MIVSGRPARFIQADAEEGRGRLPEAARHYGLSLAEQPDFAQAAQARRRVQARLD